MLKFRPFCGNSSVVEHNLAKVGVASSNLVSRSILLLLFLIIPLFSNPNIILEKSYCVEEDSVKLSFFGYQGSNDIIITNIPKDRVSYSITSTSIINAFSDRNITVTDSSEGIITFKRHCSLMGKSDLIESALLKKIQLSSPFLHIETKPKITSKTHLPVDFKRYEFIDVQLQESVVKKNNGTFVALFKADNKEKKLYFSYEMNAKAMAFKAKRNLLNGKILTDDDYESVWMSLDALPPRVLLNEIPQNSSTKASLKEGQVLMEYHLEVKKLLSKKETIKALFKDQGLVIEVQATLMDDANIGEIVKIKTEQGKTLNAKIISAKEAVIVE